MNKFKLMLSTILVSVIPMVAVTANVSALTYNNSSDSTCHVSTVGTGSRTNAFTIDGNEATAYVQVEGNTSCKETISLASWNAAYGTSSFQPAANQRYYTGKTITLDYGKHYVAIPVNTVCMFQADIVLGSNPKGPNNNANYTAASLIGFKQVFAGICSQPAAPTTTTTVTVNNTPTNVNTNVNKNTTTVVNNTTPTTPAPTTPAPSTPAATTETQPTALVNTGPGNYIAIFVAVSLIGAIAHNLVVKRRALNS